MSAQTLGWCGFDLASENWIFINFWENSKIVLFSFTCKNLADTLWVSKTIEIQIWDRQSSWNCFWLCWKISNVKTNGEILSYDHTGRLKNQKSPKILKLKLAPGWPGITLLGAKELALRVISFKQLGVSPDSGMIWLRFGIRKLIFHQFLRKL